MIWFFAGAFVVGILGMVGVVARHAREIFQLESPSPLPTAGERRVLEHVSRRVRTLETYGKLKLRPLFFSSLARALKWTEERMVTLVRSARKYQRELSQHARVSPKESQYWKDISEWKSLSSETDKRSGAQDTPQNPPTATPTGVLLEPVIAVAPEVRVVENLKVNRARAPRVSAVALVKTLKHVRKSPKKSSRQAPQEKVDLSIDTHDNSSSSS